MIGADGKAVEVDKDGNPINKNGAFKIKGKAGYHDENGNWVDDAEGPPQDKSRIRKVDANGRVYYEDAPGFKDGKRVDQNGNFIVEIRDANGNLILPTNYRLNPDGSYSLITDEDSLQSSSKLQTAKLDPKPKKSTKVVHVVDSA